MMNNEIIKEEIQRQGNGSNNIVNLIVVGHSVDKINVRVKKLFDIRHQHMKTVLVTPANRFEVRKNHIFIKPLPNPLGLLRLMKLEKGKKWIESYLYFPSRNILFAKAAYHKLKTVIAAQLRLHNRSQSNNLLSTIRHRYFRIKTKKKIPTIRWVNDWQDLWSYDSYYFNRTPKLYRHRLKNIEKKILDSADINVTTNYKAKEVLKKIHHDKPEKIVALSHPFDKDDLNYSNNENVRTKIDYDENAINIGFLGNIFKPPKVPGFEVLKIFDQLNSEGIKLKLHIFGDESADALRVKKKYSNSFLRFYPKTNHSLSVNNVSQCNFLLLALSDLPVCHTIMHAKIPHYLKIDKPILAIVPENSMVAEIIRETNSGFVIPPDGQLKNELKNILKNYPKNSFIKKNQIAVEKYSWENISSRWISILK